MPNRLRRRNRLGLPSCLPCGCSLLEGEGLKRKDHGEGGTFLELGFGADAAAVDLHGFFYEGEPEAPPFHLAGERGFHLVEFIEDVGDFLSRDAGAVVSHRDKCVAVLGLGTLTGRVL